MKKLLRRWKKNSAQVLRLMCSHTQEDVMLRVRVNRMIAEKLNCPIFMYDDLGHAAYEEAKDFNERVYTFLMK